MTSSWTYCLPFSTWPLFFKAKLYYYYYFSQAECGILVPWSGIKPVPSALEALSLNHWTAREVQYLASWEGGFASTAKCFWVPHLYKRNIQPNILLWCKAIPHSRWHRGKREAITSPFYKRNLNWEESNEEGRRMGPGERHSGQPLRRPPGIPVPGIHTLE